jgi:enterochelin esterase-like enzyme
MASQTSKANSAKPVIDMSELGKTLTARRAALGNPDLPRNAGQSRTESKKALLKAIDDAGGKW